MGGAGGGWGVSDVEWEEEVALGEDLEEVCVVCVGGEGLMWKN